MKEKKFVHNCPICHSSALEEFINTIDYAQSEESFHIQQCTSCKFLMTSPRPDIDDLSQYYKKKDYISHSDSGHGFLNSIYRIVRSFTLKQKLNAIRSFLKQGAVLDIGSGAGYFVSTCQKAGFNTIGIEPDESTRLNSIKQFNIEVYEESKLDEFEDSSFDLITLWHVLEHVPDLNSRMVQIKRLLKSKSYVWIALPNPDSYDAKHYQKHWAGYDVPRHLWHFRPENIKQLAGQYDLEPVKISPMYFDSFYVSMLSEKYMNSSLGLLRGFFHATWSNIKAALSSDPLYSSQIYIFRKIS